MKTRTRNTPPTVQGRSAPGLASRLPLIIVLTVPIVTGCASKPDSIATDVPAPSPPAATAPLAGASPSPARRSPLAQPPRRVPVDGLTLGDAVGVAVSRHPDIGRANALVAQSASEVEVARSAWYPTIEYGLRPGYGQSYGSDGNSSGVRGNVGVSQLVHDFGRTSGRVSAAQATLAKQQYMLADTIETVAYHPAQLFVELASSQETIAAAERQVAALRETRAKIDRRVKAGLSNVSDRFQADTAIERALADALKARTRFDVAAGKLAEVTGVWPQRVADLARTQGFIASLGAGDGSSDVEQTPAVLAASRAMEAATARVGVSKAERMPSIGVGASRSFASGSHNADDNTWIGVSLNGTFSTGGQARYKIAAAEAERRAAAEALENQRLTTRTALRSAETEAAGAAARIGMYDSVRDLWRQSRDLHWQEYTLNKRLLTDVISAERDIYLAESERINAVADGILAVVKRHVAVGKFFTRLRERETGL